MSQVKFEVLQSCLKNEHKLRIHVPFTELSDYISPNFITDGFATMSIVVQNVIDDSMSPTSRGSIKIGLICDYFAAGISEIKLSFGFQIIDKVGNVYYQENLSPVLLSDNQNKVFATKFRRPKGDPNYVNLYPSSSAVFKKEYVIYCVITIENLNDLCLSLPGDRVDKNVLQLQQDFKGLLSKKLLSDVTLTLGKKVVDAHKCVLSSRSSVFQRMLSDDKYLEAQQSNITLNDDMFSGVEMNESVLDPFLNFLYTGMLEYTDFNTSIALYFLGDYYGVPSLKTSCSDFLKSHLADETVFQLVNIAHLHDDSCLKNVAIDYISSNFKELESSEQWADFAGANVLLAGMILKQVSSRFVRKSSKE